MCQEQGLKRTIQTWARIGWGACLAAVLAACGGGASSGGTEEATVSVRVEGLTAGALTLVDDRGHTAVLSANGVQTFARMAAGTTFTPSIASQPSNQVCALDAGARTAASGLELRVRCEAGLLTTSGLRSFSVDQMVVMDTLDAGVVSSASLGGQTLTFDEAATGGFTFRVPALTAGAHELRAVVNGRAFTTTLDITANPLTGAPDAFLRTAATDALTDIQALLNDPATTPEERAALEQLQTALAGMSGSLTEVPPELVQELARLLAANDADAWLGATLAATARVAPASAKLAPADAEPNLAACNYHATRLGFSVSGTVALLAAAHASMSASLAPPATLLGVPATAVLAVGAVKAFRYARADAAGVAESCVGVMDLLWRKFLDELGLPAQVRSQASSPLGAQRLARLQAQATSAAVFNHGENAVLEVRLEKSLLSQVSDRLLAAAGRLVSLHQSVAALVSDVVTLPGSDLVTALRSLQRSFTEPARALSIEGLPVGFSGSIAPVLDAEQLPTGRYTVVFRSSIEPTSSQPVPFSFRLRETEADYLGPVISATLQVPLTPVAADLAFETNVGTPLSAHLTATHATGFALVSQPASGRVVLDDAAAGAFTYTPVAGFSGTVSFTYRASNSRATSQTATVVISVLEGCALYGGTSGDGPYFRNVCTEPYPSGFAVDGDFFASRVPIDGVWFSLADGRTLTDYVALNEYLSLPTGRAAQVTVESVSRDAVSDTFTINVSSGDYATDTGALASASADQLTVERTRDRAVFVRHPVSGQYVVGGLTRAGSTRVFFSDGVARLNELRREVVNLEGLDTGTPVYRTQITRCRLAFDPDNGSVVGWTVETVTADNLNTTGTSRVTSSTCPLTESALLSSVGPERGLNELTFSWR